MDNKFLYIISGDDDFLRKRNVQEIITELSGGNPDEEEALEIISGDNQQKSDDEILGEFISAWRTPPFLTDHKIIWLRHFSDFNIITAAEPKSPAETVYEMLLSAPDDYLKIVIDAPGLDARSSLYKKLVKNSRVSITSFQKPKANDKKSNSLRQQDIEVLVSNSGKKISSDAIRFLSETIGASMGSGALINEVEKLLAYVGDAPEISLQDCLAITSQTPETLTWVYTSNVVENKLTQALLQLNLLMKNSQTGEELRVISALSNEYQKQIQTRLALEELGLSKVNSNTFYSFTDTEKSKYPNNPLLKLHPFRAFKVCEAALAAAPEVLAKKLKLIRDTNLALISGKNQPKLLLEELTRKLIGSTGRK